MTNIQQPFHQQRYRSVPEAWQHGFNPEFWRWGLVFNQGNEMSVSKERVQERLKYIASKLLREMYGNQYREKAKIQCLAVQHGSLDSANRHFHVLVGIVSDEIPWSDFRIRTAIEKYDRKICCPWEKPVHVDYDWELGNRYHSYVTRYLQSRNADNAEWFALKI